MKGCLSLIIKTLIAICVFFGLKYLGIIDFIQDKIDTWQGTSQERMLDKTKDIVDLSQIDSEYSIDKSLKILKCRMIIAQHNGTGQRMAILEPLNENMLTKEDIQNGEIYEKVKKMTKKYKVIKFDKIEITKTDRFYGIEQTIPYAKVEAKIANLPISDFEGIVGAAELKNGMNIIVFAFNEKNKYSQIITEAFFRKVKSAQ